MPAIRAENFWDRTTWIFHLNAYGNFVSVPVDNSMFGDGMYMALFAPSATPVHSQDETPLVFRLHQNYPNPFNPSTAIRFDVPRMCETRIEIFNVLGASVEVLVNGTLSRGVHVVHFDGSARPSGVYFCRMTADDFSAARKIVVLR